MKNKALILKVRTWYGLNAVAEIDHARWHRAGFGRFLIHHPPLVNGLLRRGLSISAYRQLSAWHEIGHLQMLPLEFFYAVVVLSVSVANGHNSISDVIVIFISCFAAWEISAESYVLKREAKRYISYYHGVSLIPRYLFWAIAVTLVLVGWVVALR